MARWTLRRRGRRRRSARCSWPASRSAGLGWRGLFVGFAVVALALVLLVRRSPESTDGDERPRLREALRALTRREVFRWLFLLELSDLLARRPPRLPRALLRRRGRHARRRPPGSRSPSGAAPASLGAAAMIPLLRRVDGLRYLRRSAAVTGVLFLGFLLVPGVGAEARARRGDRARQRRLVSGPEGAALRRTRRRERPRADGGRPLPAERGAAARDRGAGRALGARVGSGRCSPRRSPCSCSCRRKDYPDRFSFPCFFA